MDMFWRAPPISRTLTATSFILSVLYYTGYIPFPLHFHLGAFVKLPPQIWRLFTSFILTGPKYSIIFDPYFLYMYGSKLEISSPKFSHISDFFTYIVFVCTVILGLNIFVTGGVFFIDALILAFVYTATQDERGQNATFIIITIPAQWMPYAMVLVTLILNGMPAAKNQATGLVAAHLYDFLTRLWPTFGGGRNLLPTPGFVRRMWQTDEVTVAQRGYGTAITPAERTPARASGSSTSGVLPESWRNRGSGHRLGGS